MRWRFRPAEPGAVRALARALGIHELTARVLVGRGVRDPEEAEGFLHPSLQRLPHPFQMPDAALAAQRLRDALGRAEHIAIYGDYDADGICATALLVEAIRRLGGRVTYYIPHRTEEGYGLNPRALAFLRRQGVRLLITVDCGVTQVEEVRWARALGMDVIITDHHEVSLPLPPALAVLNPKRPDRPFRFRELAGVGVAWWLLAALRALGAPLDQQSGLDLVALGTVGDLAPLRGLNRILVHHGLQELARSRRPGIVALRETCGLEGRAVGVREVSYRMVPRLNASGRVGYASEGVELLLAPDLDQARQLARCLETRNQERQRLEEQVVREARQMALQDPQLPRRRALVLCSPGWHPGVVGIGAMRLVEEFNRPVVLLCLEGERARGSGRSVEAFPLYQALRSCSELLEAFGGHALAAGLSLRAERVEELRRRLEELAAGWLSEEDLLPCLTLDGRLSLGELNRASLEELGRMAPFGSANPEPTFAAGPVDVLRRVQDSNGSVRLYLQDRGLTYEAVGPAEMDPGEVPRLCLAFTPVMRTWQGVETLRLLIRDLRPEG